MHYAFSSLTGLDDAEKEGWRRSEKKKRKKRRKMSVIVFTDTSIMSSNGDDSGDKEVVLVALGAERDDKRLGCCEYDN